MSTRAHALPRQPATASRSRVRGRGRASRHTTGLPTRPAEPAAEATVKKSRRGRKPRRTRAQKRARMFTALLFLGPMLTITGAASVSGLDYWNSLPSTIPDQVLPTKSTIVAADGTPIAEFFSENRTVIESDQIPDVVKDAVIAIEDERFYEHGGLDIKGTVRALVNNVKGEAVQGGSSITQQYTKNLLLNGVTSEETRAALTSRSSYDRKLRELRYAFEIESTHTKDEIITGYLNTVYFGDGAYGIAAAAQHYFSKNPVDLTLDEATLLAATVQNPGTVNPVDNLEATLARSDLVLNSMDRLNMVTPDDAALARESTPTLVLSSPPNGCASSAYPFYCQQVRDTLANDPVFGETPEARQALLYKGGMTITTNLNPAHQNIAQQAADDALGRDNRVATAIAVVTPGTGAVTAMAQNRTFGQDEAANQTEIVYATTRNMQPGSAFKPITLAAAIDAGFDLDSTINTPAVYSPPGMNAPPGGFTNSSSGSSGNLTAAQGLVRSSNTFFVKLQATYGTMVVKDMAERLGYGTMTNVGPADAALTLGTEETSPVDLANVYATLAAHGVACAPTYIATITVAGEPVPTPDPNCHQAIRPAVADAVANLMTGVIDGPDPLRTGREADIGRPAAGKTGTTQNNGAVWFAGFTPQAATAVWIGDPRGPTHSLVNFYANGGYVASASGGKVAAPIWQQTMKQIHEGAPVIGFPAADPSGAATYTTRVPDVRGLTLTSATLALEAAGLRVKVDTASGANRTVETTSPAPGAQVPTDATITLE